MTMSQIPGPRGTHIIDLRTPGATHVIDLRTPHATSMGSTTAEVPAAERASAQPAPEPSAAAAGQGAPRPRARSLYIDSLRTLALLRVFLFHCLGWAWLPLAFPSMGVMFALAGSLMAASLDRARGSYGPVLGKRIRRLLPPVWLMGAVLVPVMVLAGWTAEDQGTPLSWQSLWLWVLPLNTPPRSDLGSNWVIVLWYIRTYLWFVVLSPATLWMFRHWPKRSLAAGLAVVAGFTIGLPLATGATGEVLLDMSMFFACWLLGYARHDGMLQAVAMRRIVVVAAALAGAGLAAGWYLGSPGETWWVVSETPLANALYGLGFTVLLLRLNPRMQWLSDNRFLSGVVKAANSRAVTLYLWGNVAIFLAVPIMDHVPWLRQFYGVHWQAVTAHLLVGFLVWMAAMLLFGWMEDVAAGRPVRINPWPRRARVRDSGAAAVPGTSPARRASDPTAQPG